MPAFAAAAIPAWTAAGTIGTAASALGAAALAGKSANKSAKLQTDAATKAGQLEADAQAKALAYTQQKDAQDRADALSAQRANYDQWAYSRQGLNTLGSMLGLPDRPLPAPPAYLNGGGGGAPSGGPAPNVDWTAPPDKLSAQISAYFKARGVSDHETPYWVSKAGELTARGKELGNPNYANEFLARADVFGGGGAAPSAPRNAPAVLPTTMTIGSMLRGPRVLTPALEAPTAVPRATIGSYLGR